MGRLALALFIVLLSSCSSVRDFLAHSYSSAYGTTVLEPADFLLVRREQVNPWLSVSSYIHTNPDQRVHLATVDVRGPWGFESSWLHPEDETKTLGQTTLDFAVSRGADLAINGGPYGPVTQDTKIPRIPWGHYNLDSRVITGPENPPIFGWDQDGHEVYIGPSMGSLAAYEVVVSGFQLLMDRSPEDFPLPGPRHPRTAIGYDPEAHILYILVAEGRMVDRSVGLSLRELSLWFYHLGAHEAVNLDGGGSSTMVVLSGSEHRLWNTPINDLIRGRQRVVGSHLALVLRE